jgi:hypothetical protein
MSIFSGAECAIHANAKNVRFGFGERRSDTEFKSPILPIQNSQQKAPFYPLNYGDGMKAKVRRMKEEVQRSGITI